MPRLVTLVELLRRSTEDDLLRRQVSPTTTGGLTSLSGPVTITIINPASPTPPTPPTPPAPSLPLQSSTIITDSPLPSTQLATSTSPSLPLVTFADSPVIDNGVSPGVIGGIIVGTVAILIVGLFFFLRHRAKYGFSKPKKNRPPSPDTTMLGISTMSTRMGPDTSRGTVTLMSQYSESRTYTMDNTSRFSTVDIPPPVPPKPDNYTTYPPSTRFPQPSHTEPTPPEGQIARPAPPVSVNYLAKAIYTYVCTLPDELPIQLSQVLRVLVEYDDGWCFCETRDGMKGMVPMECLEIRGRQSLGSPSLLPYTRELNRQHSLRASSIAFSQILNPSP